ncbi:MAG: NAD(P)-dependent oxidoreductase [Burkholderiaceae bacterium]
MTLTTAFIGLGRMGWPMAAHLSPRPTVFDINEQTAQSWLADNTGGRLASSITEAVEGADLIISSLPADAQLLAVLEVLEPAIKAGATWIDHSTTSAQAARQVAERLAERNAHFLDAPVSGGVDGACRGNLTVMVGGDAQVLNRIEPVLEQYAARVTHMGPAGSGQVAKMTNQICVIGLAQALAEGLDFASRAGLDTARMVQVMQQGSSTSWMMENRADRMLAGEYDHGFSTALMRKDLGLVLEEARAMNVSLPVTGLVGQFLADVEAMGGEHWDWSALMERQRKFAPVSGSPESDD